MDKVQNLMVIVLDKNKRPLGFTSEKRAKQMLSNGDAVVHCIMPFVIRHKAKDSRQCDKHEFRIKLDPGSGTTGIAITDLDGNVYFKMNLVHKGQQIVMALTARSAIRGNRRSRNTGYRRCKHKKNQKAQSNRPEGWLPPSIVSIENNIVHWVKKLMKWVNIVECYIEDVKFDFQKMENPNISGVEYQHDTYEGKTVREYLLEKCGRTCQYCGGATGDKKLEVEHMVSKANGGHSRIGNLTIACSKCNKLKCNRNLDVFFEDVKNSDAEIDQKRAKCIEEFLKGKVHRPKNYGAWVNSYHKKLIEDVEKLGFKNIVLSDGVTTMLNRMKHHIEKEHYNDATCVGDIPDKFNDYTTVAYIVTAKGRGTRLKGKPNKCGILNKSNIHREKTCHGFQTGDICKLTIPSGKYQGAYIKRIAIRHSGSFDFRLNGKRAAVSYKYCKILQRGNGYDYRAVCAI